MFTTEVHDVDKAFPMLPWLDWDRSAMVGLGAKFSFGCVWRLDETTRRFALARLKICFGGPKAMSQALANGERLKKGILLEGIGKVEGLSPAAADVAAGEAEESRPGTSEGAAAPEVAEEVQ